MAADVPKSLPAHQACLPQGNTPKRTLLRKPRKPKKYLIPIVPQPPQDDSEDNTSYEYPPMSPAPSGIPSIISPPPPSELISHPELANNGRPSALRLSRQKYTNIEKNDLKYILDPLIRGQTHLGTYVEGKSLVKPYRARGPQGLPLREPKRNTILPLPPTVTKAQHEDDMHYKEKPVFTLQDFARHLSDVHRIPLVTVKEIMFSKHTYKQIQKLLFRAVRPTNQSKVHFKQFHPPDDMPVVVQRIPQEQLLLEMAALIKQQMALVQGDTGKIITSIRTLPKYSPDYKPGQEPPHTEIVLYEDKAKTRQMASNQKKRATELNSRDNLFPSSNTKYFQGTRRSNSPFDTGDDQAISPSELAVLDSIINGGKALSLKANFVHMLPDITPLVNTLTYLNLSFNDFRVVPLDVFSLHRLRVLKLRNNPLSELPMEIGDLTYLHTLTLSFCMLTHLPLSMFSLKNLRHLDLAYNKLSFIPNEVKQLRKLSELNIEGNQLPGIPIGLLYLTRLKYLKVKNNYMHPLFWKENSQNAPQRLLDVAALACNATGINEDSIYEMKNIHLTQDMQYTASNLLENHDTCDCCKGVLYGPGLRIIRPVDRIFSIANLPFLFHSCSPKCRENFMSSPSTLTDMLYDKQLKVEN